MASGAAGHRTLIAAAALVREGRILLGHRLPTRRAFPDCWDLVGGHVEAGETPQEAVVRECREEIGVQVVDPSPMDFTSGEPTLDVRAFLVTRWHPEPFNAAPDEHDDLRWFSAEELRHLRLAHPASLPSLLSVLGQAGR